MVLTLSWKIVRNRRVLRILRIIVAIIGVISGVLGIYDFGATRGWWTLGDTVSTAIKVITGTIYYSLAFVMPGALVGGAILALVSAYRRSKLLLKFSFQVVGLLSLLGFIAGFFPPLVSLLFKRDHTVDGAVVLELAQASLLVGLIGGLIFGYMFLSIDFSDIE